jgi:hypothetical protein
MLAKANTLAYRQKSSITIGMYYKALGMGNVQQIDTFHNKLMLYIANHNQTNFYKHTSLLRNPYIDLVKDLKFIGSGFSSTICKLCKLKIS